MFVRKLAHETGVMVRPRFEMIRLFFALILFLFTLKYGLSTSAFAASPETRRRIPAGVR